MEEDEKVFLALLERGEEAINVPVAWASLTRLFKDEIDLEKILREFEHLKLEAADFVGSEEDSVQERLGRLNDFFTRLAGFRGNQVAYGSAENSFLDDVLRTRLGIPISLSIVFMELGKASGLHIDPIGFPAHFLVCERSQGIVCDPFHGRIGLSKADCLAIATRILGKEFGWDESFLAITPNSRVILRMLNNLRNSFLAAGDVRRQAIAEGVMERVLALAVPKASAALN